MQIDVGSGDDRQTLQNTGKFFAVSVIPRKVLLFFRKISTGVNHSIRILPGIFGFSMQMVSASGGREIEG